MIVPTPEPLLTPEETAAILRLAVGTIYNLASQRRIDSVKCGRRLRFTRAGIAKFQQVREAI